MNRRRFLQVSGASVALALHPVESALAGQVLQQSPATRGWLIYVDKRLGRRGDALVQRILSAVNTTPLLAAFSVGKSVIHLDTDAAQGNVLEQLAYNHAILIARSDDSLMLEAWQREATISAGEISVFGFGNLRGPLGYIESDRNPFLHAANIAKAPFECQLVAITGTDDDGIDLAVDAFLSRGLINGIVARQGQWSRPSATLLDRDPIIDSFSLPAAIPDSLDSLDRIAVTQASEDEYRGVLADSGLEPVSVWRAKYYKPGQWDAAGEAASFHNYAVGLHRRAYGNTVWAATFASDADASKAAPFIARAAGLSPLGSRWHGNLPPYAWGIPGSGDATRTGTLELWVDGQCVLMASQTMDV